jgi:cobyrinic acid a,c-diamide synthase
MSNPIPTFLVAGTSSGVGKTTLSFTLMALLQQKGYAVQPFKIGPDYIDGGYHRLATGKDSINLDLWMMGWKGLEESFRRYSTDADVAVIEGMGALYDGENGTTSGSSAEIAKRLKIPIVLVLDIWGATVTTGAILEGMINFDKKISIVGVILNRAGSKRHYEMVMKALKPSLRKKVIGYLIRSREIEIPERHLGLRTLEENPKALQILKATIDAGTRTMDVNRLVRILNLKKRKDSVLVEVKPKDEVRLGIAKDEAFCFYYAENLRLLQEAGAELVYFSPLEDKKLPPQLDGLYLGGGYPESFPQKLSANKKIRSEILQKIKEGMPVYAECGGLMYLSESIKGFEGKAFPMVSAVPLKVQMDRKHLTLRYVEIKTTAKTLLGPVGTTARGHEFHYSRIASNRYQGKPLYRGINSAGEKFTEGFANKNLLASYSHLHFKSNPLIPAYFVQACLDYSLLQKH